MEREILSAKFDNDFFLHGSNIDFFSAHYRLVMRDVVITSIYFISLILRV